MRNKKKAMFSATSARVLSIVGNLLHCIIKDSLDVGRVHEVAVYESNMSIELYIESNHVGLPITPIPDWCFGTFYRGRFISIGKELAYKYSFSY